MKANEKFQNQPKKFWAYVRLISEQVGYTSLKKANRGQVLEPTIDQIAKALADRGLSSIEVIDPEKTELTAFGNDLLDYFSHRANVLNN
jgi:hypothetical protein